MNKKVIAIMVSLFTLVLVASAAGTVFAADVSTESDDPISLVPSDGTGDVTGDGAKVSTGDNIGVVKASAPISSYDQLKAKYDFAISQKDEYDKFVANTDQNDPDYFANLETYWGNYADALEDYDPALYNAGVLKEQLANSISAYNTYLTTGKALDVEYQKVIDEYGFYENTLNNFIAGDDFGILTGDWYNFLVVWNNYDPSVSIDDWVAALGAKIADFNDNVYGPLMAKYNKVLETKLTFEKVQFRVAKYLSTHIVTDESFFDRLSNAWNAYVVALADYESAAFGNTIDIDDMLGKLDTKISNYLLRADEAAKIKAINDAKDTFDGKQNYVENVYLIDNLITDYDDAVLADLIAAWKAYVGAWAIYDPATYDDDKVSEMIGELEGKINAYIAGNILYKNYLDNLALQGLIDDAITEYNKEIAKIDLTTPRTDASYFAGLRTAYENYLLALKALVPETDDAGLLTAFDNDVATYVAQAIIYQKYLDDLELQGFIEAAIDDYNDAKDAIDVSIARTSASYFGPLRDAYENYLLALQALVPETKVYGVGGLLAAFDAKVTTYVNKATEYAAYVNKQALAQQIEFWRQAYIDELEDNILPNIGKITNPSEFNTLTTAWRAYVAAWKAFDPTINDAKLIADLDAQIANYFAVMGQIPQGPQIGEGITILDSPERGYWNGWGQPPETNLNKWVSLSSNTKTVPIISGIGPNGKPYSIVIKSDNQGTWDIIATGDIPYSVLSFRIYYQYKPQGSKNEVIASKDITVYISGPGHAVWKIGSGENYKVYGVGDNSINEVRFGNIKLFEFLPPGTTTATVKPVDKPDFTAPGTTLPDVPEKQNPGYVPPSTTLPDVTTVDKPVFTGVGTDAPDKFIPKFSKLHPTTPDMPSPKFEGITTPIPWNPNAYVPLPSIDPKPPEKQGYGKSYGSVTATNSALNPFIVQNSNHFCYAVLTREQLEDGVTLDLVVGNKIEKIGEMFVQLVNGKIVITVDGIGSYGALAFSQLPTVKNGNIHTLKTFKHNNVNVIDCPNTDIIYLYVHFASWSFPL